jgi:hypothetical protein
MGGGANQEALAECHQQFIAANSPEPGRRRDPEWRPLDLATDQIEVPESGRDYGATYADDRTAYHYWRT